MTDIIALTHMGPLPLDVAITHHATIFATGQPLGPGRWSWVLHTHTVRCGDCDCEDDR